MVNLEQWLMLLALSSLAFGGCQLQSWQLGRGRMFAQVGIVMLVPLIAALMSGFLAAQSVVTLQQQLIAQAEFLSVLVLLEALLVSFSVKGYKLPLLSTLGAIVYGQMLFYQAGWLSWSFMAQGVVYGAGMAAVLLFCWALAAQQPSLAKVLVVSMLVFSMVQLAQLPPPRQFEAVIDFSAIVVCLAGIASLILLGTLYGYGLSHLKKRTLN